MSELLNPNAVIGSNQAPDYAREITDQMARDYAELVEQIDSLLEEARGLPPQVGTEEEATTTGLVVKQIRDAYKRANAYRESEKQPFLRRSEAIDAFFFGQMERCARRNPRDRSQKPGAADVLQARIDDFLERKRAEEEARRRREAEEAARIAREAQERAAREAREAEEARLAAERARKPENVAARTSEAQKAEEAAAAAEIEAAVAQERAQDTRIATLAAPAEMARTRGDGVLLTQAREPYAVVTDRSKLDKEALWPFFTDAEVEKAVRGWARTTGFTKQMAGAEIGHRRKGVTR
jgi:dTMP kinase